MRSKHFGILVVVFTILGLAGSTASLIMNQSVHGLAFYLTNYSGDLLVLVGGILLLINNKKGIPFIYAGSVLFGLAGIISMSYSLAGGIITVLISLSFILLARKIRFE